MTIVILLAYIFCLNACIRLHSNIPSPLTPSNLTKTFGGKRALLF